MAINEVFSEKYRPKKLSEIIGQGEGLRQIISSLKSKERSMLIHGPIGCGKTSAVHAAANDLGYDIIEMNTSDLADKRSIREVIGNASAQRSLFSRSKIIFIDEIDSLGNQNHGSANEISSLIDSSSYPIIMCANKPFEKSVAQIRKKSKLIQFKKIERNETIILLKKICEKEEIMADENCLRQIALLSEGDIRAAINDLQASGKVVSGISVSKREKEKEDRKSVV